MNIAAKKTLGQHWLNDQASLDAMCETAEVREGDTVLEVGPGQGTLTTSLLRRAAKVIAVELDERLAKDLIDRFPAPQFTLNMLSILDFDLSSLPEDYKIVANIPYYLTSNLLRKLTEASNKPSIAALLVQKEVAERVVAMPGDMSVLSVAVQFYYETSVHQVIPAKLFQPPPKVDSQILKLTNRQQPLFTDTDIKKYFRVVKAGFSERRKKLRSSLSGGLHISKQEAEELLKKVGINPDQRAQELSLQAWHKLHMLI